MLASTRLAPFVTSLVIAALGTSAQAGGIQFDETMKGYLSSDPEFRSPVNAESIEGAPSRDASFQAFAAQRRAKHGHDEMKRYEQIHTDRERSRGVFDARHQGLAMQYVPSMANALRATLSNLEAVCTNTELAIDELNFTRGPSLMFFANVTGE